VIRRGDPVGNRLCLREQNIAIDFVNHDFHPRKRTLQDLDRSRIEAKWDLFIFYSPSLRALCESPSDGIVREV
jgi:hypothetical protein